MAYFIHNKYDKNSITKVTTSDNITFTYNDDNTVIVIDYYGLLERGDNTYKNLDTNSMGNNIIDTLQFFNINNEEYLQGIEQIQNGLSNNTIKTSILDICMNIKERLDQQSDKGSGFQGILTEGQVSLASFPAIGLTYFLDGCEYDNKIALAAWTPSSTANSNLFRIFLIDPYTNNKTIIYSSSTMTGFYSPGTNLNSDNYDYTQYTNYYCNLFVKNGTLMCFCKNTSNVSKILKYSGSGTSWTETTPTCSSGSWSYPSGGSIFWNNNLYIMYPYYSSTATGGTDNDGLYKLNFSSNKFELVYTIDTTYNYNFQYSGTPIGVLNSTEFIIPIKRNASYTNAYQMALLFFNTTNNTAIIKDTPWTGDYDPACEQGYVSGNGKFLYFIDVNYSTGSGYYPRAYNRLDLNTWVNTSVGASEYRSGRKFYYKDILWKIPSTMNKINSVFNYATLAIPDGTKLLVAYPDKNVHTTIIDNVAYIQMNSIANNTYDSAVSVIL